MKVVKENAPGESVFQISSGDWWGHSRIVYEYSRDILTYILGFWFDCMDFPWLVNPKSK